MRVRLLSRRLIVLLAFLAIVPSLASQVRDIRGGRLEALSAVAAAVFAAPTVEDSWSTPSPFLTIPGEDAARSLSCAGAHTTAPARATLLRGVRRARSLLTARGDLPTADPS